MQSMQASHVQTQFSLFKRILSSLIGLILVLDGAYLISLKKIHFGTVLPVLIGMMLLCYAIFYIVKLLYYSYKIRKKLEITHRLSRSTILYAYV